MQTFPIVDLKQEMITSIIARSVYVSLQNDDRLYEQLLKLPYKLLVWKYNSVVKIKNN